MVLFHEHLRPFLVDLIKDILLVNNLDEEVHDYVLASLDLESVFSHGNISMNISDHF